MTWTNHVMVPHPTANDLDYFLTEAMRIAQGADQILLEGYGHVTAQRKGDGSLVTETDQAVDLYVTSELTRSFPQHAVLSEELNTSYDAASSYTWVIDPLDGTTNFARGLPIWGSSFALLFQGFPVLGYLSFVSLREQYWAIQGQGAYLNGVKITTAQNRQPDTNHFMMQCTRTQRRYRVSSPLKPRILGSAAYHIAAVAKGAALAGIEATPKLWDIAAALLILIEAGGSFQVLGASGDLFPLRAINIDYKDFSFPLVTAANSFIMGDWETNIVSGQL